MGREALMVGDRRHDVEGAHANGVACLAVTYGFGTKEELRSAGADWICERPTELYDSITLACSSVPRHHADNRIGSRKPAG